MFLYRVIWRMIASGWTAELGGIYFVIIMCRLSYMADYLILRVIIMCDITTNIS